MEEKITNCYLQFQLQILKSIKANPNFSIIGHITAENQGLNLVTRANQEIELKAQGWNALKEE